MQSTRLNQALVASAPLPLAPELLKLIGGGVAAPTSSPTPQAPKNKW
jgi:hypothetical protein